jgi:HD-GYP domain-containing protein (c-di-GMP phosphodiesterase class II)
MISDRSYRAARPHAEAMECLAAGAGSQFDPVCVEAFATVRLDPARIASRAASAGRYSQ